MSRRYRNKYTGLLECRAECRECSVFGDAYFGRNAMGLAAQHAARTGHEVHVEQSIVVTFNRRDKPES